MKRIGKSANIAVNSLTILKQVIFNPSAGIPSTASPPSASFDGCYCIGSRSLKCSVNNEF